jgi:hypothetical protein
MFDPSILTLEQQEELLRALEQINIEAQNAPRPIEYRVYYDENGKVITYTTDINHPGDFLVITQQEYLEARHDAIVKDGKLVQTHIRRHVFKLVKGVTPGRLASKYDASVLVNDEDEPHICSWGIKVYEIVR